jgi:hypothetical protein
VSDKFYFQKFILNWNRMDGLIYKAEAKNKIQNMTVYIRVINNSIQFFIIYMPRQKSQANYRQHSVNKSNYIMDSHNIKSKSNYRQALEKNTLIQRSKKTKE